MKAFTVIYAASTEGKMSKDEKKLELPDTTGVKLKRHKTSLEQITKLSEERLGLFADLQRDEAKRLKTKSPEIFVL